MILKSEVMGGVEWQLWKSDNPSDPLAPHYIVKKFPDGTEKLHAWGIAEAGVLERVEGERSA